MDNTFFLQALLYLTAAVICVPIAKKLGLGSVLGYLIAGILIGPFVMGFIGEEGQDIMHFAEFGVVMMLFLVGLELEPSLLWRMRKAIAGLGGLQVGITAVVFTGLSAMLGMTWAESVAIGLTLALSSTAICLQTLNEKGLMKTSAGQNSFAVLLFQDIAVIPILAFMPLLAVHEMAHSSDHAHGASLSLVEGWAGWLQTLAVLAAVGLIVWGGPRVVRPLMQVVARTRLRELFTASALLIVVAITVLMILVGLSPALGTFLAGVVLANSEYRHELESDIEPFKGLLLGLFFIAVGASIDFELILAHIGTVAGLVFGVMLLKIAVMFPLGKAFRMGTDQALVFAVGLGQVGEFGFVLLSFIDQQGVLGEETVSMLMAVVTCTMALTPLFNLVNERFIIPSVGTKEIDQEREPDEIEEENPVIIAGFGRFGNIAGRFLRANGVGTTVLDIDSDRVEILRKLDMKVYFGDATRYDMLHAAGAEKAQLIIVALDDPNKNLEVVATVKKHFPHLHILMRAKDRPDYYQFLDEGLLHIYRETLDSSLRLGVDALKLLGHRAYRATRAARTFMKHDEKALKHLAAVRGDRKKYLSTAREKIAELEDLMLADLQDEALYYDEGWDAESLRQEANPSEGEKRD
jgi:CPA2 family monovalent cation:H+ antiporter-2